jgi:hypothetical protein
MPLIRMVAAASAAVCLMGGASAAMADEVDVTASSPTGTSVTLGAGTYDVSEIAGVYTSANLWLDDAEHLHLRISAIVRYLGQWRISS